MGSECGKLMIACSWGCALCVHHWDKVFSPRTLSFCPGSMDFTPSDNKRLWAILALFTGRNLLLHVLITWFHVPN